LSFSANKYVDDRFANFFFVFLGQANSVFWSTDLWTSMCKVDDNWLRLWFQATTRSWWRG
jgi:hypothetical protein